MKEDIKKTSPPPTLMNNLSLLIRKLCEYIKVNANNNLNHIIRIIPLSSYSYLNYNLFSVKPNNLIAIEKSPSNRNYKSNIALLKDLSYDK